MLSKNNDQERLRKMEPKQDRFSIRKFTIGAASVLIGSVFFAVSGNQAQASAKDAINPAPQTQVVSKSETAKPAVASSDKSQAEEAKPQTQTTMSQADAALNAKNVSAAKATVAEKSSAKQPASKNLVENKAQAEGKETAAAQQKTEIQPKKAAAEKPAKDAQALADSKVKKTEQTSKTSLVKKVQKLAAKEKVATKDPQTVSDWAGFVGALSDTNVDQINLDHDITINGKVNGVGGLDPEYKGTLTLTGKGIARTVTINGNGKTINFGQYNLAFQNNNYEDTNKGWNITFKNLKFDSEGIAHTSGLTHNGEKGQEGLFNFNDVNAANQKKTTVTFDGVTAHAIDRPVISGAKDQNAARLDQKLHEYYTLNFAGKNNITADGYVGAALADDHGNAVEAGYINFLAGTDTTINMTKTGPSANNYGGNAVRAVQDGDATKPAVNVENGAKVTINGGKDVRGIYAGADKLAGALDGLVNVDGTLTENLGAGHSTAINAGNLTVGTTGNINITTAQDNNHGLVGNATFNGNHYGVIALGVGHLQGTYSSNKNTLTDNGSITIKRTATDKLSAPLIAFGGGGVTGNYELTVNPGATLDLQDSAKQQSSDHAGMITMFGTSSTDLLKFNNPGYVNLQRVGQGIGSDIAGIIGNFLELQGNGKNQATITGTIPVSQWDQGNVSDTPSFVWSINDLKSFNEWGTNAYQFIGGKDKLINTSQGTVIMGANQAGKDSFEFENGTVVSGNPTDTTNPDKHEPYLNQFLNHFSWWKAQRLSFGTIVSDAEKYNANYQGTTAKPGEKKTIPSPTIINNSGKIDLNVTASYSSNSDTPSWAIVNSDGSIDITAPAQEGPYTIPVNVTYGDGSSEVAYAPVVVADDTKGDKVIWNQDSSVWMKSAVDSYHKTNDGSEHDPATNKPAAIQSISYTKYISGDPVPKTFTYELSADGKTYNLVAGGNLAKGADDKYVPASFSADQIKTAWKEGYKANSDVTNFPTSGTGTSLAKDQLANPYTEQKTKENDNLPGNSKARILITYGDQVMSIFGVHNDPDNWCNAYGNYYGAKTGTALTFKQGQDISNLTQDQYRQLIDVTDLGKNGWNGQNINPNAPQILAYLPGTGPSKEFTMTWAPDKMASTATVRDNVEGTVRIHFNDGTYLDIVAHINVVKDIDAGKPDNQKSGFTQKIVYTYNNKEVAYTEIDNINKGSDVSADKLKNAIDTNVPKDYQIANGFNYPAGLTNVTKTPAIIYVPLQLKDGEADKFNAQGKLIYQTEDGKTVGSAVNIKSHIGDTLTQGYLHDIADQNVPANYVISKYPGNFEVTKDGFVIPVIVKDGTRTINSGDKDQTDDMFSNPTRTINVENPDGTTDTTRQVVSFQRSKIVDVVTGKTISYGRWELKSGSKTQWDKFTTPSQSGYTPSQASVAEQSVTAETKDQTITITYHKNGSTPVPYKPGKPGVNDDMNHYSTRKIITILPNGTRSEVDQTVHFVREDKDGNAGYKDPVTDQITWNPWHVVGSDQSNGTWAEHDVNQLSGYKSQVDGKDATKVDANNNITAETPDQTVYVTYVSTNNGGQPTKPGDKGNKPGDKDNKPGNKPGDKNNKPGDKGNNPDNNGNTPDSNNRGEDNNSVSGKGNSSANIANGQGLNSKGNGHGNSVNKGQATKSNALPQTGAQESSAGIFGLALAALAGLVGLAGDRKRKN